MFVESGVMAIDDHFDIAGIIEMAVDIDVAMADDAVIDKRGGGGDDFARLSEFVFFVEGLGFWQFGAEDELSGIFVDQSP